MKKLFAILPLALTTAFVGAEETKSAMSTMAGSVFEFSADVNREVERDLMHAVIYSQKSGKSLTTLKNQVSENLNKVLEAAKANPSIKIQTNALNQYPNYNNNNKVDGWTAEGSLYLESKDFEAMAKVLENLGNEVAIRNVNFSVSAEKLAELEDEMTLEIIKQFQHKANVIQKGINAKSYVITDVQLHTPNARQANDSYHMPMVAMAKSVSDEAMPLEAGKQTISATASGKVKFE